jgi:hypothetical protein
MAIVFHLLHNFFAIMFFDNQGRIFSTIWDWSGYVGLLILILILINREQHWMKEHLADEVNNTLLTPEQYQIACSAWKQSLEYIKARFQGNSKQVRKLYQTCGDLMHKKRQLSRQNTEEGTILEIQRLRSELADLSKIR